MVARALAAGTLLLAGVVAACGSGRDDTDLTVFAAASLTDAAEALGQRWLDEHPGNRLTITLNGTNVLAAQIAEGAPADVLIAADVEHPEALARDSLTAGQPRVFAASRVTIAVPREGTLVQVPQDLARPGVRLVAAGAGVPITRYADEALARLAASQTDPEAFLRAVSANIVSREDNVRAALAKVELGEGDAAIVYATDVLASARVREVPLPPAAAVSAEYAVVAVSDSPDAAAFTAWLSGPEAADILERFGFQPRGDPP